MSTRQLEKEFGEGGGAGVSRSCIWNKYRRGEVVPRSGGARLVERVEARYPGTAKWLFSPLWRLADRAPMAMVEIRNIYEELPRPMRSIFIHDGVAGSNIFWRRSVDSEHACDILQRFGDVDGLIAVLAMVKEAEITQDQEQHWISLNAALQYGGALSAYPPLFTTMGSLRIYLKERLDRTEYFSLPDSETDS